MRTHLTIHAFATIVLLLGELVLPTVDMLMLLAVSGVLVLIMVDRLWHATISRERQLMVDATLKVIAELVQAEKA